MFALFVDHDFAMDSQPGKLFPIHFKTGTMPPGYQKAQVGFYLV
jgi:hypothetical protein